MENLTLNQIKNADFKISKESPILKPFDHSFVVADPSLLTPNGSPDNKWHLFFHTHLGIYHFESNDGIQFEKVAKVANRGLRPNINNIDGTYYLFYERTRPVFMNLLTLIKAVKWKSEIYCIESKDLKKWTEPKLVIGHTRNYEKDENGLSISNPFLFVENNIYRMYYSCGQTFIKDCGFCEPTYVSYAESNDITYGYVSAQEPIISPNKESRYTNLCSGCLKVYRIKDGYIGIQNGIYEKDGKSHSGIILLSSSDGLHFNFEKVLVEPMEYDSKIWMKQYVYASHLVKTGETLRLYFNARDTSNMLLGRECIGFAQADIK